MKRLFSLAMLAMAAFPCAVNAQNIQVHYDLGHSLYNDIDKRPSMTTTMEMFKPDRWGSTFAFIDLDYQRDGVAGTTGRWHESSTSRRTSTGQPMWNTTAASVRTRRLGRRRASNTPCWQVRPGTGLRRTSTAPSPFSSCGNTISRTATTRLTPTIACNSRRCGQRPSPTASAPSAATATSGTIPTSTGNGSSSRSHNSGSTSTNSREWTTSTSVWDPRWNCPTTSFGTTEASTTASTPSRRLPPNGLFSVSNVRG